MAERDELLDHNYDGIQEYDNDLPRWWIWLFVLTVVWGVWRVLYYHGGPGLLQEEQLAQSMDELQKIRAEHAPKHSAPADDSAALFALTKDPAAVEAGKGIFAANCIACHMTAGQGLIGPNLTDSYWLHGGKITDIQAVVTNGVPEKGMIAWKEKLTPEQIRSVTAYVWTLHGTNPPNPKQSEGALFERQQ